MSALPKPSRERDEAYLSWIRKQPCVVTGKTPCDASHIQKPGMGKMGSKAPDRRAVPMIREVHLEYHRIGHVAFECKYAVDLESEIEHFNRIYREPTPKRVVKERSSIVHTVILCACGLLHKVPPAKFAGSSYFCFRLKRQIQL